MKGKGFAGAVAIVLALAACQKSEEAEPGAGGVASTPSATEAQAAAPDAVDPAAQSVTTTDAVVDPNVAKLSIEEPIAVSVTDNGIEVKGSPVPGATQFQVTNNGTQPHSLAIEGPGGKAQLPVALRPQEVGTVTLDVTPGTYRLYCPMEPERLTTQLEVAAPPS